MKRFLSVLTCGLLLLAGASEVVGQSFQGAVRGAVRDEDRGLIPGVTLTLVNEDNNISRTSVTNDRGEYVFAQLAPGTYTLMAELAGFAPFNREGLIVGVQRFLVIDVTLRVGGIEETVTVTGETPLIETATASIASAIDRAQMDVLPTPGRNVFIMAVTTPGVVHAGDPVFVRMQDQTNASLLSLGGGPLRANNYTLDGVSITDLRNRSFINPAFGSLEEMKVQIQTYDAEMGRTSGGVFNSVHKTGGNDFTGSGLWQNRPHWGRSAGFFEDEAAESPYNLWAATFGGPIVADKAFFWGSFEGYKNTCTRTSINFFPTRNMANGNFAGNPRGVTLIDPLTGQPFPGNVIPPGRLDPVGVNLANQLADLADAAGELEPSVTALLKSFAYQWSANVNTSISDAWQLNGTFMFYKSEEPSNTYYREILGADTGSPIFDDTAILFRDVQILALNSTHIPSDDSVLTLRFGYARFFDSPDNPAFTSADAISLGFDADQMNALSSGIQQFPYITVTSYGSGQTHGSWSTSDTVWKSVEGSGVYSKFVGSHTFKVGAQYRQMALDLFENSAMNFTFDSSFTGDNLADMLLGRASSGSATIATQAKQFINYYGGFVQDDWRVKDNLVLNLGLRIAHETGLAERDDGMAIGFDRDSPFPIQVPGFRPLTGGLLYAGVDGNPSATHDPPAVKWGPRAGFAYSVNDITVIRGGYGVFWAPHAYSCPNPRRQSLIGFSASTNLIPGTVATLSNPFPFGTNQPTGNSNGRLQNLGGTVNVMDQFRQSPYIQQWSLGFQRELTPLIALSIGYAGSKGTDLPINGTEDEWTNLNQLAPEFVGLGDALNDQVPNPFFGTELGVGVVSGPTVRRGQLLRPFPQFDQVRLHHRSTGRSRYDSLRFEVEKRFRGNWGARINYAWTDQRDNGAYRARAHDSDETVRRIYRTGFEDDEFGPSRLSISHQINLNALYRLPSPDGGTAETILGGWSVSVSSIFRSGFPMIIRQSSNWGNDFGYWYQRPNLTGVDPQTSGSTADRVDNYIDPAAYAEIDPFTFGNTPHTDGANRTPWLYNWDISFEKTTPLGGGANLQLRFEFINAFNQPNWGGPENVTGTSNFGQITTQGGFPRVFAFMVKVNF